MPKNVARIQEILSLIANVISTFNTSEALIPLDQCKILLAVKLGFESTGELYQDFTLKTSMILRFY